MKNKLSRIGGKSALDVLKEFYVKDPTTIDIESIILAKGAHIQEKPLKGSQGRILIRDNRGIITINSNISDPKRKRFILAHEFGHFMLHSQSINQFSCNVDDFVDWQGTRPEEAQANRFAANFLMPPEIFLKKCESKRFSLSNVEWLSSEFQTSFMATAIRFAEYGNYPCALVYSVDGIVQWATYSKDFPTSEYQLNFIRFGRKVPEGSVAFETFENNEAPTDDNEIDATEWFSECFEIDRFSNWKFKETCKYYAAFNSVLSFIYTY